MNNSSTTTLNLRSITVKLMRLKAFLCWLHLKGKLSYDARLRVAFVTICSKKSLSTGMQIIPGKLPGKPKNENYFNKRINKNRDYRCEIKTDMSSVFK